MLGSTKSSSVELWENLVLGAGKGFGFECWCGLPCDGRLQRSQARTGFSNISGDSSVGPPGAAGL